MRFVTRWIVAVAAVFAGACAGDLDVAGEEVAMGRLVDVEFTVAGSQRRAALYVPAAYSASTGEWPLIVFLHGLGERGNDNTAQTDVGIYTAIRAHPERFPCLVLMPQCPGDSVWAALDTGWARDLPSAASHVDSALEAVLREYRIARDRIALTGLSMGGFGTLIHGAATIDRWCALVAVCGGGRDEDAAALARRPLWLLHGAADPIVPKEFSESLASSVRAAGGAVELTLYPGVGHNAWDRAYGDAAVIEFLLAPR